MLLGFATILRAQVQEQKLMDRLLRPNMNLQNSAEGKQFNPGRNLSGKTAEMKSFYLASRPKEKNYSNVRALKLNEFSVRHPDMRLPQAALPSGNRLTSLNRSYALPKDFATRPVVDDRKTVRTFEYAETRAFLIHGKSEKSLNAQNRPLTIDEVRELLNKNK